MDAFLSWVADVVLPWVAKDGPAWATLFVAGFGLKVVGRIRSEETIRNRLQLAVDLNGVVWETALAVHALSSDPSQGSDQARLDAFVASRKEIHPRLMEAFSRVSLLMPPSFGRKLNRMLELLVAMSGRMAVALELEREIERNIRILTPELTKMRQELLVQAATARKASLEVAPMEFRQLYFDLVDELRNFVTGEEAKEWNAEHRKLLDGPHFIKPLGVSGADLADKAHSPGSA